MKLKSLLLRGVTLHQAAMCAAGVHSWDISADALMRGYAHLRSDWRCLACGAERG